MTATTLSPPRTSAAVRTGIVLAVILAISDIVGGIPLIGEDAFASTVAVFGWVMAIGTLVAVPAAWRGGETPRRTVVLTRLLGALTAVPAFFLADVATGLVLAAAATVLAAIVVAVLVLPRRAQS
jgi:hypothetical protein